MRVLNHTLDISSIFPNGKFDFSQWEHYADQILPGLAELYCSDMHACISTGMVSYEKDYLPVLQAAFDNETQRREAIRSFRTVTDDLSTKITFRFGRCPDVDIILLLGLCGGAGWVTNIHENDVILLGIEKIMELGWDDVRSMLGLIYHELGHVYQAQYGVLERPLETAEDQFLWQLFTEGVATYFEQLLMDDPEFFHQDRDGWKSWCDDHVCQIKLDFHTDLPHMTFENQRFFGDWVYYNGHNDVGYYLGARFVQFICRRFAFDEILDFSIDTVKELFNAFMLEKDSR